MPAIFLVMLGGAIGAGFRFHISSVALRTMGYGFPWGTWIINLLGGLLMGILAGALARDGGDTGGSLRLFLGVGVLGGFTTFSAFSLEAYNMLVRGDYTLAATYAMSSAVGSVMLLAVGVALTRVSA